MICFVSCRYAAENRSYQHSKARYYFNLAGTTYAEALRLDTLNWYVANGLAVLMAEQALSVRQGTQGNNCFALHE